MERSLLSLSVPVLLAVGLFQALLSPAPFKAPARNIIDLTHPFDERTIYWPTAKPFTWEKEAWGPTAGGYWYSAARYSASEHGGTHLDAPIHFAEGRQTVDEIPLSSLIGPGAVIDVTGAAARNPDYRLGAADVVRWEGANGRLQAGSIVLVRTGWARSWGNRKAYLGDDRPGEIDNLHFPGIGRDAAELLVARGVHAVGIDTASLDHGPSKDFIAHRTLAAANVPGLENVASLERLPATGATIIALPMKIKGGSGGPNRIIAILP